MARAVKQVLVLRRDYPANNGSKKLRTGKYVAQGAHGSTGVICDMMKESRRGSHVEFTISLKAGDPMIEWLQTGFTKITLYVSSDEELLALYQDALRSGLPNNRVKLITDAGRTEFGGKPTRTVVALGPWWADEIDELTKGKEHIKLF